ncbi:MULTISPECIES: putative entry exclusion protein TrbK-alt [Caulobacter]|jgi:conjugative transfer region protein TrbK|uniref:Conjugative transfer region protein TrbK n=1 Tax=Caulobacter vibrioides OR37 TaxID=1292034 RepID=R0CYS5_CAUVI|nr:MULTISPECIES: putative entry exclusion protein TrbK-alt [Caulobacter]ENZ81606.1 hypothetical protein OR37_02544 [Caulobacter vibrioides OR37]PIB96954.1 hypothetical protein CSW60_20960 [Caulobacter sp. X]
MTRSLVWGTVLIILLGAAVLAGGASQPSSTKAPAAASRDPDLARCQALGEAGAADAQCRAAWARFFGGAAS